MSSSSKIKNKNKAPPTLANEEDKIQFCVEGMKPYFIKFKDSRFFTLEKSSNLAGLGS